MTVNDIKPCLMRESVLWLAALATAAPVWTAPVPLVQNGQSRYVICRENKAPASVKQAAVELQHYFEAVTGAKLSVVQQPQSPMIALGALAARAIGVDPATLPAEGYRMVVREGDLFIFGPDTSDGEHASGGGTSCGTRNGVYTFIERSLGVRWLMPGPHGEFVPKQATVMLPAMDTTEKPGFLNRRLPYIQEKRREVKRWCARQKLGFSLYLSHGHNWRRTIPAALFDQHPDWFAMRNGRRMPPLGRYKLCITNPGLIQAYAEAAIHYFETHPEATCYSLSPSDSAGWCECPKCTALYETDPNGKRSVTPAILRFYNRVGRIVRKRFPNKLLAGYVYSSYVFPPRHPIRLEPNVFLVWAPSFDYGYTLFRPALRKQWAGLLTQWTHVTHNISYYDLFNKVITDCGALDPPALDILRFVYPRLARADVKGVYVYGVEAWGRGGLTNYLLARLAWNPGVDVDAVFSEYCRKAWGRGAPFMEKFWRLMDAEMKRHYTEFPNERYTLTTDLMRDVYAKNFPELERLYRQALAQVQDADARTRLEMVGANLTSLLWRLRQAGQIQHPEKSGCYLTDRQFYQFLNQNLGSLALHPVAAGDVRLSTGMLVKAVATGPVRIAAPLRRFRLRGNQHLVLQPSDKRQVVVRFSDISSRGKLVTWAAYDGKGRQVARGLMSAETPVRLKGDGGGMFHVRIAAGSASFQVTVEGARWAVDSATRRNQGVHLLGKVTPLYFFVPDGVRRFSISLIATPPGETALAKLTAPDGKVTAQFDCSKQPVDRQSIPVGAGQPGWWRLDILPAPTGVVDDVWVQAGPELSGTFCLAPDQALAVRPPSPAAATRKQ